MVWHTVPRWIQAFFPERIWTSKSEDNAVYLTFDDGPVPGATDFVLDELEARAMKATFFMVGDNVRKHPVLAQEVVARGHAVGNHTYHHLNGWKTKNDDYFNDLKRCDEIIQMILGQTPTLFRPPYGLLKSGQAKTILKSKKVVMWDVLSGDYDAAVSSAQVLKQTIKHTQTGSIILFHDQEKTQEKLKAVLPQFLDHLVAKGWNTQVLC